MNSKSVDMGRRVFFFEDHLQAVSQRLPQTEEADFGQRHTNSVRTAPILNPRGDSSFKQHEVGRGSHHGRQAQGRF